MSIESFAKPYKELYAIHNHLLDLGFSADDIFVGIGDTLNPVAKNVLCAHLRTQGKEFVFTIAPLGSDIIKKEVYEKWTAFVYLIKEASDEEIKEVLNSTIAAKKETLLVIIDCLKQKGFRIPKLDRGGLI